MLQWEYNSGVFKIKNKNKILIMFFGFVIPLTGNTKKKKLFKGTLKNLQNYSVKLK